MAQHTTGWLTGLETLRRLQRRIPLTLDEVPDRHRVFDWTASREWNIRDADVRNTRSERVIDFQPPIWRRAYRTAQRVSHFLTVLSPPHAVGRGMEPISRFGALFAASDGKLGAILQSEYDSTARMRRDRGEDPLTGVDDGPTLHH